jgi:hypothetical protein
MGKLIDNLSNVYKGGVITITDTVESLDINMESQDLEQVAEESNINLEPNTTATSGVSMSDSIVPAPSDSNVSILKSMRAQFYSIYGEVYNKIKEGGTTTITKDRYDEVVQNLRQYRTTEKKTQDMKNNYKRYSLGTQVRNNELFRRIKVVKKPRGEVTEVLKKVAWYENLFDIIHDTHLHLAHARDPRPHKTHIDKVWWGVTERAIQVYIGICPECLRKHKPVMPNNLKQLKFIFSETIGSRAQADLIDYSRKPDGPYKWVLRYVDHHSGFAHVASLPNKEAKTVGKALVKILATAVLPEILHTDNGGEFTGKCIEKIKKHYPTIHIVKGRPRHPQSQGCVERGNSAFKEALEVWKSENPTKSWAELGVYVVNGKINGRPSRQKGGLSPYEIYYGKHTTASSNYILNQDLIKQAQSEYGLSAIHQLMDLVSKKNPNAVIDLQDIATLVEETDKLCDEEEKSMMDGKEVDYEAKVRILVEQLATTICSRNATSAAVTNKEPKSPTISKKKSTMSASNNKNSSKNTPTPGRKSARQAQQENNNTAASHTRSQSPLHKKVKLSSQSSDSPGRKEIRQLVLDAKIKTARAVNASRKKKAEAIGMENKELEVNDVCTLRLEGVIKSTFRHLPVLVTEVMNKGKSTKYKLATKHGFLKGTFSNDQLDYRKNYTGDILQIKPLELDTEKELSVQQAATAFGGHACCNCQGDCSKISRCSCKAAGTFCTSLCHRGRGGNKQCTLFSDLCNDT